MSNRQKDRSGPGPTGNNRPGNRLGRKYRKDFGGDADYTRYLESKLEKKKGKKKGKGPHSGVKNKEQKKEGGNWWDSILDIGMKILPQLLAFLRPGPKPQTYSFHSGPLRGRMRTVGPRAGTEVPIPAGTSTAFKTTTEPTITSVGPGRVRITHGSVVGTLKKLNPATAAAYVRGECMFQMDLTPNISSWLRRVTCYQHYRFLNVAVSIQPSVPTITAGRILGCYISDVDAPPQLNQGDTTITTLSSLNNAVITDIWTPHTWICSFRENDWYYTSQNGIEPRTNKQGVFMLVACSTMDDDSIPDDFADILVSYEMLAEMPMLMEEPSLGTSLFLESDGGTCTYPLGSAPVKGWFANATDSSDHVPPSIVFNYSTTGFGTGVAGSNFQFPPGYYMVWLSATGTGFSAWTTGCVGQYVAVFGTDGLVSYNPTYEFHDATGWVRQTSFKSTGMTDNSSMFRITMAGTTLTTFFLLIAALGGRPAYKNPYMLLEARQQSMERQIAALTDGKIVGERTLCGLDPTNPNVAELSAHVTKVFERSANRMDVQQSGSQPSGSGEPSTTVVIPTPNPTVIVRRNSVGHTPR
jgi:hypothetical protein